MELNLTALVIIVIAIFYFGRLIKKTATSAENLMDVALDSTNEASKVAKANVALYAKEQRADLSKRATEVSNAPSHEELMAQIQGSSKVQD